MIHCAHLKLSEMMNRSLVLIASLCLCPFRTRSIICLKKISSYAGRNAPILCNKKSIVKNCSCISLGCLLYRRWKVRCLHCVLWCEVSERCSRFHCRIEIVTCCNANKSKIGWCGFYRLWNKHDSYQRRFVLFLTSAAHSEPSIIKYRV